MSNKEQEAQQSKEIEMQSLIYNNEITVLKAQSPYKFKIHIKPILETEYYTYHYEYMEADIIITFEQANNYPYDAPMFYCETTHAAVSALSRLKDLEDQINVLMRTQIGEPMIYDVVEFIRVFFCKFKKIETFV